MNYSLPKKKKKETPIRPLASTLFMSLCVLFSIKYAYHKFFLKYPFSIPIPFSLHINKQQ